MQAGALALGAGALLSNSLRLQQTRCHRSRQFQLRSSPEPAPNVIERSPKPVVVVGAGVVCLAAGRLCCVATRQQLLSDGPTTCYNSRAGCRCNAGPTNEAEQLVEPAMTGFDNGASERVEGSSNRLPEAVAPAARRRLPARDPRHGPRNEPRRRRCRRRPRRDSGGRTSQREWPAIRQAGRLIRAIIGVEGESWQAADRRLH